MSTSPGEAPSQSEWKILKILFERGPSAARDIVTDAERLHGWSSSTVKTLLRRLVDKGHLKTRRVGNSFLYRTTRPAQKALRPLADDLLENAVEGTVGPLLAYLVRKSNLTPDELEELRALLDRKDTP